MNLTGKWKGYFRYGREYGPMGGETEYFEIDLIDDQGSLLGRALDKDDIGLIASISGFHEDGFISFVKKYDKHLEFNEDYTQTIIYDKPFEVEYTGNYFLEDKKFYGQWEITYHESKILQPSKDFVYSGVWGMEKIV